MKGKTHDLTHDLTFSVHTINYVCHSIRLMFIVLGISNFDRGLRSSASLISFFQSICLCFNRRIERGLFAYINSDTSARVHEPLKFFERSS